MDLSIARDRKSWIARRVGLWNKEDNNEVGMFQSDQYYYISIFFLRSNFLP